MQKTLGNWPYNYVQEPELIPEGEHYAILKFETVRIADGYDNDSRGTYPNYHVFTDKMSWEKAIAELYKKEPGRQDFCAIKVAGKAKMTLSVEVKVGF
jgi:hypothetical protein